MKACCAGCWMKPNFSPTTACAPLSQVHREHPYQFALGGHVYEVGYEPAESRSRLFGGNSNWRGPVWMPLNFLIIESLQKFHHYYGDDFKIECPTGSGKFITINQVARNCPGG